RQAGRDEAGDAFAVLEPPGPAGACVASHCHAFSYTCGVVGARRLTVEPWRGGASAPEPGGIEPRGTGAQGLTYPLLSATVETNTDPLLALLSGACIFVSARGGTEQPSKAGPEVTEARDRLGRALARSVDRSAGIT